jgi:hypothetical protein
MDDGRLEIALIGIKCDPLRARLAGAALHNLTGRNQPLIQTLEMHIRILSDLHREIGTADLLDVAADVVVLAGDIDHGIKGVVGARQAFPSITVNESDGCAKSCEKQQLARTSPFWRTRRLNQAADAFSVGL